MTELATVTALLLVTALIGFLRLLATLVFLWKVYKRGGRRDLTAAAQTLREARHRPMTTNASPTVDTDLPHAIKRLLSNAEQSNGTVRNFYEAFVAQSGECASAGSNAGSNKVGQLVLGKYRRKHD